ALAVEALVHYRKLNHDLNTAVCAGLLRELGLIRLLQKRSAEAETLLREYVAVYTRMMPDNWHRFYGMSLLGGALLAQQKYADAEPLLVQGYEGMARRTAGAPTHFKAAPAEALGRLVQLYDAWGKPDEAAKWRKELAARLPQKADNRP